MAPTVVTHDVEAVGYVVVAVWIYETVDFPSRKNNVETVEEAPGDSYA
jgi:hypothetical protein